MVVLGGLICALNGSRAAEYRISAGPIPIFDADAGGPFTGITGAGCIGIDRLGDRPA